jgi:hypothetical protein
MSGAPPVTRQQLQAQDMQLQPMQQQPMQQNLMQQHPMLGQQEQKPVEDEGGIADIGELLKKYWKLFI